jgi:antitoxin FitA
VATLTVRNLEDDVVRRLRVRAAEHGRSAEAEHRDILRTALACDDEIAARRLVAERLTEFRRRAGGRDSTPVVELLAESRAERLRSLTGDEQGGEEGA